VEDKDLIKKTFAAYAKRGHKRRWRSRTESIDKIINLIGEEHRAEISNNRKWKISHLKFLVEALGL
jgi:hypothetical protein